jgi:hypothetical protein
MNLRTQIAQTHDLPTALRLASEASAGRHGALHIAQGALKGTIYYSNGRIVAADIKGSADMGVQALQKIMSLKEATFLYEEGQMAPAGSTRISFAFQELLKDGLALVETEQPSEASRIGDEIDQEGLRTLTSPIKAIEPLPPPEEE